MAFDFPSTVAPQSSIEYHKLPAVDPRVISRIPLWVNDPIAFCKEACNFHPHWYQTALINDQNLFVAASWSRQIGKSEAVAHKALHHAFTHKNEDVIIIAPGLRQAKLLYRKVVKAIEGSPLIYNSVHGKIKMEETEFTSGCRIVNLPSGDEGVALRGYTIALLITDEAAFIPDDVYVAVEQGLSSSGGQEIQISTPRGKHNQFYRLFFPEDSDEHFPLMEDGRMQNTHAMIEDWSCHHYDYTVGVNVLKPNGKPQLSEFHVMRQKRKLLEWAFRSEYLGEFVEDLDSFFNQAVIQRMFNPRFSRTYTPEPGGTYFAAIDIAKTRDYTAIGVGRRLDTNPFNGVPLKQPHLQVVWMNYWKGHKDATIEEQYPRFMSMAEIWAPLTVFFDKTSMGERPAEELQNTYSLPVEPIHFTQSVKVGAFGTLNTLMSTPGEIPGWKSRIQCYQDGEAAKQFGNLVYELGETKSRTGRKRPGDNIKIYASHGHDDIPVMFALLSLCVGSMAVTAPLATMPKETQIFRDAKIRAMLGGFAMETSPVAGFGDKTSRARKSSKIFW